MDASAAARRRLARIGATPSVGAANAGADTEIAATEAVARARSSADSGADSQPHHEKDERDRPAEERFEMAAETRRMLLEAVDPGAGNALWRVQGEAMTGLYGAAADPAAPPAPEEVAARPGRDVEGAQATRQLGSRAYARDEAPSAQDPPGVSKTV